MQHIQHIITRHTWLVCLSILGVALACDQFMAARSRLV